VVNPYNIDTLADRLTRLLSDEPLRRQMADAGRRHVLQNFTLKRQVETCSAFTMCNYQARSKNQIMKLLVSSPHSIHTTIQRYSVWWQLLKALYEVGVDVIATPIKAQRLSLPGGGLPPILPSAKATSSADA